MVGELKVVVLGDSGVGKSSLISAHCPPITGVDASIAVVCGVAIALCDTFGLQKYRTLTMGFYRYAKGALIVYDVTDRETFEHVTLWVGDLRLRTHAMLPIVLVANKCDGIGERKVTREEGMNLAAEVDAGYSETSQTEGLSMALRILLDRLPKLALAGTRFAEVRKRKSGETFTLSVKKKKRRFVPRCGRRRKSNSQSSRTDNP